MTDLQALHGWRVGYPPEWSRAALGRVCRIRRGASPRPAGDPRYFGGSIPWVKISDASAQGGRWIARTEDSVNEAGKARSVYLENGALILSNSGTTGRPKFLAIDGCIHDGWLAFDRYEGIDPLFLFYLLSWRTAYLTHIADGSVQKNLNTGLLKGLEVGLPVLSEQRAIARILGTLDDKIELNQRMNETLEAIARAIFKSWFVDFDPVHAKAEGRAPPRMDAEIAAPFSDAFEDSVLGKIPIGWKVQKLGDVVGINESSIARSYPHKTIEYVDISAVSIGRLDTTVQHELSSAPSRARRLVSHGDTIWSCVRPNRKSYLFIHQPVPNLVVSTGFAVLTPKEIPPSYLYAWVTADAFVDYLSYSADGSAYPAVRADRFADALILLPSQRALDKFHAIAGPIRHKVAANERESRTLAAIRDALLPKLISGQVRVKDAEKLVEASL